MDEDIKDIKRRAGITEEVYDVATQQQVDDLLDDEIAVMAALAKSLKDIRAQLTGNTFNPRNTARAISQVMAILARRAEKLSNLRAKTK